MNRSHYDIEHYDVSYLNIDTQVGFGFRFTPGGWNPLRRAVRAGRFVLPYCHPGFFGIEAECELSAFIAAFGPRIEDPQIHGMAEGAYSGEGFLRGWNFGNQHAVGLMLSREPGLDLPALPGDVLARVWRWNYSLTADRLRLRDRRFVPQIMMLRRDGGAPCTSVVWPTAMPVSLPKVDYVMLGRGNRPDARSFALAPWSEVVEVLAKAGFDTSKDPIEIEYFWAPPEITRWLASVPGVNLDTLEQIQPHEVMDAEIIAAARAAGQIDPSLPR